MSQPDIPDSGHHYGHVLDRSPLDPPPVVRADPFLCMECGLVVHQLAGTDQDQDNRYAGQCPRCQTKDSLSAIESSSLT